MASGGPAGAGGGAELLPGHTGLLLLLTITGPGWRIHIVTVSSDHITSPLILMNVRMAPQYHTTASDDITILRGLSLTSSPRSGLAGTLQCNEN